MTDDAKIKDFLDHCAVLIDSVEWEILKLRVEGETYSNIASKFKISRERAAQSYRAALKKVRKLYLN